MVCPKCNQDEETISIFYDFPGSDEIIEKIQSGKLYVAGCLAGDSSPAQYCNSCNIKFNVLGKIIVPDELENGYFGNHGYPASDS